MKGILDNQDLTIPCENCGKEIKKSIGWIKSNNKLTCSCGTIINLKSEKFLREIAKLDKAMASMQSMFKKLK